MKFFVIILLLIAAQPAANAQPQKLKSNDIFGSWIDLNKTPAGFKLDDHCDKSEIIISKKYLVFAFEFEKPDTLLIKNLKVNADTVLIQFYPNKFEFSRISAHWFDFHNIMKLSVFDEESPFPFNIYLAASSKRSLYTKGLEPCPGLDSTYPSFQLIRVE